jgi:4-hydroxy-tetrahydrodipicolinate reductase
MIRIAVNGACGRMAMRVIQLALDDPEFQLVCAMERPGHPSLGKDVGVLAGKDPIGLALSTDLAGRPQVLADFSEPKSSVERAREAAKIRAALLIGTTGFTDEQKKELQKIAKRTACLVSPNMSVGVNLLFSLVGRVAKTLGDEYDVEIVEVHHRFKKDAPSGTALRLAEKIAETTGRDLASDAVYGRHGVIGERKKNEIGIHAIRAGDAVGDHTVIFSCLGERIELVHRATARDAFARGALRAAKFLAGKPPGMYQATEALGV